MMNRRSRNNNNRGGQQPRRGGGSNRMQVFDSNGPDVRIRGTAWQVHEKYMALAKDAGSAGDRILAENYLQHAEHYQRIINSWAQEDGFVPERVEDEGQREQPPFAAPSDMDSPQDSAQPGGGSRNGPPQQQGARPGFDPSRQRRRHPYQQRAHYAANGGRSPAGPAQGEDLGLPASILGARPVSAEAPASRTDELAEI